MPEVENFNLHHVSFHNRKLQTTKYQQACFRNSIFRTGHSANKGPSQINTNTAQGSGYLMPRPEINSLPAYC